MSRLPRTLFLAFFAFSAVQACNKAEAPKPREDEAKKATPVPSDMVFNDFIPENMKIRGDAGTLPSGLPSGDVVPDTDGDKTKVTEAGADPKVARKYTFTAGKTAKRTFTLQGSLDQGGQMKQQPGITVSFDLATKAVKNGTGSMELKVTDIQLADKDKMDKGQAAQFAAQFAGGIGVTMTFDVDPHGKFGEVSVAAPDKKPKPGAAETVQLAQSVLAVLYPLLPDDPIGVGAKWEAASDAGGGKVTQVFTLKDFDKDNGTIEAKMEQHAPARQAQGEILERRQPAGGMKSAGERADRRAGNRRSVDTVLLEPFDDTNMGPTARRSRTEREPDCLSHLPIHGTTLHRARKIRKSQIISSS